MINTLKRTIYIDMDGVIADYDKAIMETGLPGNVLKLKQGIYRTLSPVKGALEAIDILLDMGFDIEVATKCPHDNPYAATEKLLWIAEHKPVLIGHVTTTSDKGQLGTAMDYIIDDRIHKANVSNFKGTILHFGINGSYKEWDSVIQFFVSVLKNDAKNIA